MSELIIGDIFYISAFVGVCYLIAGTIKGTLGLGLPTTSITIMSLVMSPVQALAINLLPMFVANMWQFSRADNWRALLSRYGLFAISLIVTIFCGSFLTARLSSSAILLAVAGAVILFALYNLIGRPIALSSEKDKLWQIIFGCAAGVMGALTSMWAVPMVIYLLSRDLAPKAFVDAAGFLLFVGCLPLSIGYVATGIVTSDVIWPSLAGTIAALIGFRIGEVLRRYINAQMFRKILLWFFLIMGMRMIVLAISSF